MSCCLSSACRLSYLLGVIHKIGWQVGAIRNRSCQHNQAAGAVGIDAAAVGLQVQNLLQTAAILLQCTSFMSGGMPSSLHSLWMIIVGLLAPVQLGML